MCFFYCFFFFRPFLYFGCSVFFWFFSVFLWCWHVHVFLSCLACLKFVFHHLLFSPFFYLVYFFFVSFWFFFYVVSSFDLMVFLCFSSVFCFAIFLSFLF